MAKFNRKFWWEFCEIIWSTFLLWLLRHISHAQEFQLQIWKQQYWIEYNMVSGEIDKLLENFKECKDSMISTICWKVLTRAYYSFFSCSHSILNFLFVVFHCILFTLAKASNKHSVNSVGNTLPVFSSLTRCLSGSGK